jgi:hypothetical protein
MPRATRRRWILLVTLASAVTVFAVIQDRVTAAGARRYVTLQRARIAAGESPVGVDDVMRPVIQRSMLQAGLWSSAVLLTGLVVTIVSRSSGRA